MRLEGRLRRLGHRLLNISLFEKAWILYRGIASRLYGFKGAPGIASRNFMGLFEKCDVTKYNVVIIVVDCMRYMNTSLSGYQRDTTPLLKKLGKGYLCFAPAPHTYSSVPSILTGMYPHSHGAVISGMIKNFDDLKLFHPMHSYVPTIFDILKPLGYLTAFIAAVDLAYYPIRGRVKPRLIYRPAERLLKEAATILKGNTKNRQPVLVYVHLADPHDPLDPPRPYKSFFGKPSVDARRWRYTHCEEQEGDMFKAYRESRLLLYDNTLRYVNDSLENFIADIDSVIDDTIVVITADHGEEFWEHRDIECKLFYDPRGVHGIGHGHSLFNEVIAVPLVFRSPERLKDYDMTSLVDITPTILDVIGLKQRRQVFDGTSLRQYKRGRALISEAVGYGYEKKAIIVDKRYKLILSPKEGVELLYDIEHDFNEKHPFQDKAIVQQLEDMLKRTIIRDKLRLAKLRELVSTGANKQLT